MKSVYEIKTKTKPTTMYKNSIKKIINTREQNYIIFFISGIKIENMLINFLTLNRLGKPGYLNNENEKMGSKFNELFPAMPPNSFPSGVFMVFLLI